MALTINTHPLEVVTNAPEFNVTTSLTEGASFQNLRIRATIYQGGRSTPLAPLEQPKGLDDWNFFDVLKSLTGKADVPMGAASRFNKATLSSELLTGWTEDLGDFTTFTTSARQITSAITTAPDPDHAKSNDLGSVVAGDVIMAAPDTTYNDSGTNPVQIAYGDASGASSIINDRNRYVGLTSGKCVQRHFYLFLIREDEANPHIYLGNQTAPTNVSSNDFTIRKITDFKNNPGIYFKIKFEEVYEDISDVTTIGDIEWFDTVLFIPTIVRPGESFDDYIIDEAMTSQTRFIATRNINKDVKYPFGAGLELRFFFVTTCPFIRIKITTDAGDTYVTGYCPGWGIIVLSESIVTITSTDNLARINVVTSNYSLAAISKLSLDLDIWNDTRCYADPKLIAFVGDLGEETVLFRGLPSEIGGAEKSFYKDQNRIQKTLKAYKRTGMVLRALYETEETRRLLHELIYTELPVWMYDEDFTDEYREVTVLSDEALIENQKELIEPEIEVEYYE